MERLLERDTVLAELDRCRRTATRSGRVVLLRGEAGVGKTTVIARFLAGLGPRHADGAGMVRCAERRRGRWARSSICGPNLPA